MSWTVIKFPFLVKEGWPRRQEDAPVPLMARTRWLVQGKIFKSSLLTNTTPSAPSKVASQHFLEGAATPPQLRRGTFGFPQFIRTFFSRRGPRKRPSIRPVPTNASLEPM